jgi:hypothetical protein
MAIAASASWLALREGQELGDAPKDPRLGLAGHDARAGLGQPGGARVDAETLAKVSEARTVRRAVGLAEHLGDVLVGDLVLQHLDDHAPWAIDDQGARQRQRAPGGAPLSEAAAAVDERDGRRPQAPFEVGPVELVPGIGEGAKQRCLELSR